MWRGTEWFLTEGDHIFSFLIQKEQMEKQDLGEKPSQKPKVCPQHWVSHRTGAVFLSAFLWHFDNCFPSTMQRELMEMERLFSKVQKVEGSSFGEIVQQNKAHLVLSWPGVISVPEPHQQWALSRAGPCPRHNRNAETQSLFLFLPHILVWTSHPLEFIVKLPLETLETLQKNQMQLSGHWRLVRSVRHWTPLVSCSRCVTHLPAGFYTCRPAWVSHAIRVPFSARSQASFYAGQSPSSPGRGQFHVY